MAKNLLWWGLLMLAGIVIGKMLMEDGGTRPTRTTSGGALGDIDVLPG